MKHGREPRPQNKSTSPDGNERVFNKINEVRQRGKTVMDQIDMVA